ncbi:hypothetical protein WA026_013887 [Henosepilachna vigintioctopunctata]|uniref:Ionotropic receptor n=1 Tax=Henosepilachna vigintioctopunctata TaxID=420089 RepID=A0AAW1U7E1_9CUCU
MLMSERVLPNSPVIRINPKQHQIFNNFQIIQPTFYIIEDLEVDELYQILTYLTLQHTNFLNPRARVVFVENVFYDDYLKIVLIFRLFDAVFLNAVTYEIFTFDPKGKEGMHRKDTSLVRLGYCYESSTIRNLFPSQIVRKWKNFQISVAYQTKRQYTMCVNCRNPGLEIEIMTLALDHLGVDYNFTNIKRQDIQSARHIHDIFIGGYIKSDLFQSEYTASYAEDFLRWIVPRPHIIDRSRYIYLVLSPSSWLFFLLGFLVAVMAFLIFRLNSKYSKCSDIMLFIFIIFSGRTKQYRFKNYSMDFLIFSMIFMSFMLNNFFCSQLTFLLYGINFERGVENVQDIVNNKMFIGYSFDRTGKLLREMPEFRNYSQERIINCGRTKCFKLFSRYTDMVFILETQWFRFSRFAFLKPGDVFTYMREIDPPFLTVTVSPVLNKGHPLFHVLNRKIQYLVESGISGRIVKKYFRPYLPDPTLEETQKLKLEHIVSPLIILAVGLILSLITLLFELKKWRFHTRYLHFIDIISLHSIKNIPYLSH